MKSTDIEELLQRIKRGDRDARGELIALLADEERLGAVLLAMTRKVLSPNRRARRFVDSHDIVQSALRTALDDMSSLRNHTEGSLYGWLRTIIRRKVFKADHRPEDRPRPGYPSASEDPVENLIDRDLLDALLAATRDLPLAQRLVVELRLRGLNSSEMARCLGISPAAVRKREERAISILRSRFPE